MVPSKACATQDVESARSLVNQNAARIGERDGRFHAPTVRHVTSGIA
jgi:hypothetical protein